MPAEHEPTLKDVAAAAGVAVMTASRAFSKPDLVAQTTREKILSAAQQLGYRHNALAAAMRSSQSGLVGVIVTNIDNPFHSKLARGIDEVLTANSRRMLLGHSQDDPKREAELIRDMRSWRVEGLIAVPALANTPPEARFAGLPTVLAGRVGKTGTLNQVTVDDERGAQEATADLIARGARRIAFIGNEEKITTTTTRLSGYLAALSENGIRRDDSLIRLGCRSVDDAKRVAKQLHSQFQPDAFFGVNNQITLGVLEASAGFAAPPLISGFDGMDFADLLRAPVSLVTYDPAELGARAATLLLESLENPKAPPRHDVLPVRLLHYGGNVTDAN